MIQRKANPEVTDRYWGFINSHDGDNELEVTWGPERWREGGGDVLSISVSDEKAMDSYNQTFTCDINIGLDAARSLRDFLNMVLEDRA